MHHCRKNILLSLGFFSSHWLSFRKCWCQFILYFTKKGWWKVPRPQPEYIFLLSSSFVHDFYPEMWTDSTCAITPLVMITNHGTFLLVYLWPFTCSQGVKHLMDEEGLRWNEVKVSQLCLTLCNCTWTVCNCTSMEFSRPEYWSG